MAHRLPGRGACLTSTLVQTQGAGPPYKHWELLAGCHLPWCVRAEHLCQWGCWIECSLDVLTDTWRHSVSSTQLPRVQHRVCFLWGVKAVKCHSFSRKLPAYPMTPLLPSSNWDPVRLGLSKRQRLRRGFLRKITTHTDRGAALGSAAPVDFTEPSDPGTGAAVLPSSQATTQLWGGQLPPETVLELLHPNSR